MQLKMSQVNELDRIMVSDINRIFLPPEYEVDHFDDEVYLTRATQYFIWCQTNPMKVPDYKGKDAVFIEIERPRPFTKEGLSLALMLTTREFDTKFKAAKPRLYDLLMDICRQQIFEHAMIGVYNPQFAARYTQLADKREVETNQSGKVIFQLSDNRSNAALNQSANQQPRVEVRNQFDL